MKRSWLPVLLCFLILAASLWVSYYVYTDTGGGEGVASGDPAHPLSFMSENEWERTAHYSRTKDALYFAAVGFEWAVLLFVLVAGLSSRFRDTALRIFKKSTFGQAALYTLLLNVALTLLQLPLSWYSHVVDVHYGISTMTPGAWFGEKGLDFLIDTLLTIPVVWLALWIVRKSPQRWWLWFWVACMPLIVFMVIVQPLVLDPLYNDFRPLQNEELKEQILRLAHQADVPADDVYEVDMSKKTTALNAYVNGLGPSARIVLWDTTLQKLQADEILFIMAHEIGHYVKQHIIWGLAAALALLLLLLFVLSWLLNICVRFIGAQWGIRGASDLAALPLALLLLSVLSFAASPLDNYFSRANEQSADMYAVEMTKDEQAGIRSFQKLARLSLSNPNPSALVKFFRYSHPTISERIHLLEELRKR